MNNQQKRAGKSRENPALSPAGETVASAPPIQPKRGRPKSSPHDPATQNRLRVQRYRDAKKEEEEIPLEIYLPKAWHGWLTHHKRANLRKVAVEAFALWLAKEGYPVKSSARRKPARTG